MWLGLGMKAFDTSRRFFVWVRWLCRSTQLSQKGAFLRKSVCKTGFQLVILRALFLSTSGKELEKASFFYFPLETTFDPSQLD